MGAASHLKCSLLPCPFACWSSTGPLTAEDSLWAGHCLVGGLTIVTSILLMCCCLCRKLVILAPLTFSPCTVLTDKLCQCLLEVRASGLTCGKQRFSVHCSSAEHKYHGLNTNQIFSFVVSFSLPLPTQIILHPM